MMRRMTTLAILLGLGLALGACWKYESSPIFDNNCAGPNGAINWNC